MQCFQQISCFVAAEFWSRPTSSLLSTLCPPLLMHFGLSLKEEGQGGRSKGITGQRPNSRRSLHRNEGGRTKRGTLFIIGYTLIDRSVIFIQGRACILHIRTKMQTPIRIHISFKRSALASLLLNVIGTLSLPISIAGRCDVQSMSW